MTWPTQEELAQRCGYDDFSGRNASDPRLISKEVYRAFGEYVTEHKPVGDFARACIENKLIESVVRADNTNMYAMRAIALLIYNEFPANSHGSHEAYVKWTESWKGNEK